MTSEPLVMRHVVIQGVKRAHKLRFQLLNSGLVLQGPVWTILRYTFSGRDARPLLRGGVSVQELLEAGESQLAAHIPFDGAVRRRWDSRRWDAAYCGYVPFHGDFIADVRRATAEVPGLDLAGDYLRGASMEACFRSGEEAAERLTEKLVARARPEKREPAGRAPVFDRR